uniref:ShKT domain-containing protein n=1 Tax=Strongyloides papillosus TaxID=174720 RepID=A0A0N5BLN3_STREA
MKFIAIFAVLFLTIPIEVNGTSCDKMAESGYCLNSMYRKVMCTSCAEQCNKRSGDPPCELPTRDSTCSDVATNCASLAYLCTLPPYGTLLATKCKSTCDMC